MVLFYARKPAPDSSIREVSLEPSKPQEERTQLSQEMQKGHMEIEELYPRLY